jgi:bifunctional UDP-N-acetylglucosamine pyrophosphorylase/glucosamine-1-phosphate N-acetyltransferase
MFEVRALILAAGLGTRMKSGLPKVLHEIAGEPMIRYVVEAAREAGIKEIGVVVGYRRELVEDALADAGVRFIHQPEQKGTGHAVQVSREFIAEKDGTLLILPGDVPLIDKDILRALIEYHRAEAAAATVLSCEVLDPEGYGRIILEADVFVAIREEKDATDEEKEIDEVNTGVYVVETRGLLGVLDELTSDNSQGEFYLTDAFERLVSKGENIEVMPIDFMAIDTIGINTRADLAEAAASIQENIQKQHMLSGVTITDSYTTNIARSAEIGADTTIYPNTVIEKNAKIGKKCGIGPFAHVCEGAVVEDGSVVGSFTRVEGGSTDA